MKIYFDMDGNRIDPFTWDALCTKLRATGGAIVKETDLECENVIISTVWTGVPYSQDGDAFGIYVTRVEIPYSVVGIDNGERWAVDKFYAASIEVARELHEAAIHSVYEGILRFNVKKALADMAETVYARVGYPLD